MAVISCSNLDGGFFFGWEEDHPKGPLKHPEIETLQYPISEGPSSLLLGND